MPRVPPLAAFLACTLIWGTTWLAIKVSYTGIDAVWAASLRFFLAGLLLLGLLWRGRSALQFRRVDAAVIAFVGLVLFGLDYGLIYWGEQFITSGLTAILFAVLPLFTGLFSALLIPGERWTLRHGLGVLVGLGGLVVVFGDNLAIEPADFWPMAAIIIAAACAAISSVVMRKYSHDANAFLINGGAMLVGAIGLLGASITQGETHALPQGLVPWTATLYLTLFGSVISFLLYFRLLHTWGPNRSSLIVFLTPIVAVASGTLIGEWLTVRQLLGSALVLGSVAMVLWKPRLAPTPQPFPSGGK